MNELTNSIQASSESQIEQTPPDTKSKIDLSSTWRLIGAHALGFLSLVLLQAIVSFSLPWNPAMGGFAICASYFTLLSVWLAFGNSGERAWAIPLAIACFGIQSIVFYSLDEPAIEYAVVFAVVAVIYSLALFLPMILLRRITRIRIERISQLGGLYSERFNFGIGELIFATAVVATLLALAKFVVADWGILTVLASIPLCSLLHFVLVTPIVILTLSSRSEPVVIGLSLLSMAVTFAAEIIVYQQVYDFELSFSSEDLAMIVLLNVTFVLTTFLHLVITRFSGYRLVRLQLD